jgi:hypothetical protein
MRALRTVSFMLVALATILPASLLAQTGSVMRQIGRYTQRPVQYDVAGAEIVAYDAGSRTCVFSNGGSNKIVFLNMADPANPVFIREVALASFGGIVNSVAVHNGLVAVALEDATNKTLNGKVVFFTIGGVFQREVTVGALPDMLTFTPDGTRVVVCNEGEPLNDYAADPEGSVSIISLANGVAGATVATATFTILNGKQDSLRAMGVRIYGRNATVAQDLEPEYAAVSADGRTAYVTLQENNALAIVDLATATVTRVVALGYKDYSTGLPRVTTYPWTQRPLLGTTAAGQNIQLGGFSGLWFTGYGSDTNKLRFLTHPDRGPNAEPAVLDGVRKRPFALPDYQAEVISFEMDQRTGEFTVLQRTPLFRRVNNATVPISGRPNLQAGTQGLAYTDEIGVDLFGNPIPNDPYGADLEGIVVAGDGTWWLVDEYRAAIYNVATTGEVLGRYVPQGTAASVNAAPGTYGIESLPAVYAKRRANRGFEAVAIEGNILYAFIQSPIDDPDDAADNTSKRSSFCRILAFDVVTKQVVGEYLYPMFETAFGADKIGDAVSLGAGRFMVVERDDATGLRARKYLFEIDLKGATNIATATFNLPTGKTIEQLTFAECAQAGVRPVYKRRSVYLPGAGYGDVDKVEGLARINATTFAVINDNDFGVGGSVLPSPPDGRITVNDANVPVLGVLRFDVPNGFDGCDRDGAGSAAAINIRNWPVYGMYQPDAISAVTLQGQTYLITANEGDAREWGNFVEEARLSSSSIVLDPAFAAAWPLIKTNPQLARLNVVNNIGDIDGDGDYDQLYTLGGRSFSVWNVDGNLLWDSGNEFETRLASIYPQNFNAGHTTNAMDDRSDNKGPEPEGITAGVINDSTYAFIALERIGHTMMYNITNPRAPRFTDYVNSRNMTITPSATTVDNGTVGDLGPESTIFVPAQAGTGFVDLLIAGNEVSGTVSTYQVRIPRITVQPPAQRTVCIGDVLSLTVTATGPALTYQWTRDGVSIPGATQATLALPITGPMTGSLIACNVQAAGGMVVRSTSTRITTFERTRITKEPPVLVQRQVGDSVAISFEATSAAGETYQWFSGTTALVNGDKFKGVTTNKLEIKNLQFADTSRGYTCVVTGGCATPRTRNVAVMIPRIMITQQPTSAQLCPGSSAELSTAALASGGDQALGYQWVTAHGGPLVESANIKGVNLPVLRLARLTQADTGQYYCLITGYPSGLTRITSVASVTMPTEPVVVRDLRGPGGVTSVELCDGGVTSLFVEAQGSIDRYEWLRDGVRFAVTTQGTIQVREAGTYTVRIVTSCDNVTRVTRSVLISSKQRPAIALNPVVNTVVKEGDGFKLAFTMAGGTRPLTYQWYRDGAVVVGARDSVYEVTAAGLSDAGRYLCLVANDCGIVETTPAIVKVWRPVTTSVDESQPLNPSVSIAPNPFSSSTAIRITIAVEGDLHVDVINAQGSVVATIMNDMVTAGSVDLRLDAAVLPGIGAHVIRVQSSGQTITVPIRHIE